MAEPPSDLPPESWASSGGVRRSMQGNRSRDTKPEMAVRRAVHALGLRYRVDVRPVPSINRRADLVFHRARVAIFIDGCYWHGCPEHYSQPAVNVGYWSQKIARNVERDSDTTERLTNAGWAVVRIWEHEAPREAAAQIAEVVSSRRSASD